MMTTIPSQRGEEVFAFVTVLQFSADSSQIVSPDLDPMQGLGWGRQ